MEFYFLAIFIWLLFAAGWSDLLYIHGLQYNIRNYQNSLSLRLEKATLSLSGCGELNPMIKEPYFSSGRMCLEIATPPCSLKRHMSSVIMDVEGDSADDLNM